MAVAQSERNRSAFGEWLCMSEPPLPLSFFLFIFYLFIQFLPIDTGIEPEFQAGPWPSNWGPVIPAFSPDPGPSWPVQVV